jgi:hypothetical protein
MPDQFPELESPQQGLARRLNLVLDLLVAEGDTPVTFRALADELQRGGISLSRARWAYMVSGNGPLVTDRQLISAIADVLDIDPQYLLDGTELPAHVDARLDGLRELRMRRVRDFAARSLIDVAPDTLRSITRLLDDELRGPVASV